VTFFKCQGNRTVDLAISTGKRPALGLNVRGWPGRFIVSPKEKEIIIEDIDRMIGTARTYWNSSSQSREHIVACLMDRKIEIRQGEWDDDIDENNKVEKVKP
jgi:hypothetical protein